MGDVEVERETILAGVELFRHCSSRDLRRVAALAAPLQVRAGTVIVTFGTRNAPLVLLLDGIARAERRDGSAIQLERGAHLGAVTLLDGGPAQSTVTASTPMRLAVIERRNFVALMRAAPSIATLILAAAGEQLQRHNERSGDSIA
jgi:CRP-like cAMP-binding protein